MGSRFKRLQVAAAASIIAVAGLVPTALAATSSSSSAAPARIEGFLAGQLDAAAPDTRLVVLFSADSAEQANAAADAVGLDPILTIDKIGVAAVQATPAEIDALRRQPGVRYLQGNRPMRLAGSTGPTTTRVTTAEELYDAADGTELDGSGVGIAVVDSGMAGDHPYYQGEPGYFAMPQGGTTRLRNLKQLCVPVACDATTPGRVDETYFVDETGIDTDVQATGGHGTHVTGIAGGGRVLTANGVDLRGVAPAAALYGIGAGVGIFALNASASLSWILEHHADPCFDMSPKPAVCPPIKVVNNSYGSPGEYDPENVFAKISERLVLEGVTVVWAAGNGDSITSTNRRPNDGSVNLTNPPGQSPLPGVLMVANYNDAGIGNRDGSLNATSSRGERGRPESYPDVAAPGTQTLSSCRPYLPICTSGYPDPNYGEISGTSMAAPHVAGVVALLLDARPDLTPGQIEDVLEDSAYKFGDASTYEPDVASETAPIPNQVRNSDDTTSFDKGHGLVDVAAAVAAARGLPEPPAPGAACTASSPQATDVTGDAGQVGSPLVRGPSQDTLDLETVRFAYDAGTDSESDPATFTTTVKVVDLRAAGDPPATGTVGEVFDVDFTFAGGVFYTRADRGVPSEGSFLLRRSAEGAAGTSDTTVATVTGAFDHEAETITVVVPVSVLTAAVPDSTFGTGTVITPGDITAWRDEGAFLAGADIASGSCPFVAGATDASMDPDPEPEPGRKKPKKPKKDKGGSDTTTEPPAPDSPTASDTTTSFEGVIAEPHAEYSCGGAIGDPLFGVELVPGGEPWADPECPVFEIVVDSPNPYRYLDIELAAPGVDGPVTDLDLFLYDSTGAEVASSGSVGSAELLALSLVPNGTYRAVIQPYINAPGAAYELTVRTRTARDPLPYR